MKIYVNCNQPFPGMGTKACPFSTIQQAADAAMPGDEVLVAPGIYREDVHPLRGGSEENRIIYRAEVPGQSVITGAEVLSQWEECGCGIWKTVIPNDVLGEDNPFADLISGDWYYDDAAEPVHRADIYLDNRSLREVFTREALLAAEPSPYAWDTEFSRNVWMSERTETETTLYLHLLCGSPDGHLLEYSARRHCFYPMKTGIHSITLSGFVFCKAAPQWAPPTAYQEGMVGPHWAKGWVIEDCELYESKCVGISLGKYLQPNNENKWRRFGLKHGTQNERDAICQAQLEGWDRAHVGSHVIRRCNIHDCGQAGIAGHLGCVFSVIEDNHIHHINNKQNLAGAEIGGIKMHAAIDVIIRRNHIHNCTRGIWLDWQAQGTRVTGNLFHHNCLPDDFTDCEKAYNSVGEDLFIEVSHGPTLVDHNLMLSDRSLKLATQGVALVHNLICGGFVSVGIGTDNGAPDIPSPRYTPYHTKHGTQVAGFMTILHGDDRFYNNIFVQKPIRPCMQDLADLMGNNGNMWDDCNVITGTFKFNGYPTFDEWNRQFEGYCGMGSETTGNCYYDHLPVWASGNLYFNGARAWEKETDAVTDTEHTVDISVEEKEDGWYLKTNLYDIIKEENDGIISTETLGMAFEPEQKYENPDGSPIIFNQDFFGNHRDVKTVAGPFTDKKASEQKLF